MNWGRAVWRKKGKAKKGVVCACFGGRKQAKAESFLGLEGIEKEFLF